MSLKRLPNPLFQLVLVRFMEGTREPGTLFGLLGVPMILAALMGFAFRAGGEQAIRVAVTDGPRAAELTELFERTPGLKPVRATATEAEAMFRHADVRLVVVPTNPPELRFDPKFEQGQIARARVIDAINTQRLGPQWSGVTESPAIAPGSRYIDFLLPGLVGMTLMSSCVGLGMSLVWFRMDGLLKRLLATPMRKSDFLLSHVISRSGIALAVAMYYVLGGWLLFGVKPAGSVLVVTGFCLLGATTFSGLGILLGSRSRNLESIAGITALATLVLIAVSGSFFSLATFPPWLREGLRLLPLTALNDGLRAYYQDGTLASLARPAATLAAESALAFGIGLRWFKWI